MITFGIIREMENLPKRWIKSEPEAFSQTVPGPILELA